MSNVMSNVMSNAMLDPILVIGYGAVGAATVEALARRGDAVRVAQRKRPANLPQGVSFVPCDLTDAASLGAAVEGAAQIVLAVGLPYVGKVWREMWPKIMRNVVEVAAAKRKRVVFIDNLYMYGPQSAPLTEETALSDYGLKPAARTEATRIWKEASTQGRLLFAALRPPDFYGPGVTLSVLGDTGYGALARGGAAIWLGDPDLPHDVAYVPDVARAALTLLDAPDDAFGQAWHVPCAPTRTGRELIGLGAAALGVKPRIRSLPIWALRALGTVQPTLGEFAEMRFAWDRPYRVDASKFTARFGSEPTPFEVGAPLAARSFRKAEAA